MTTNDFIHHAQFLFEQHSTTEKAPQMKAYMKNKFEFLGLSRPERDLIQKDLFSKFVIKDETILESAVRQLWALPHREYHYLAMDLMVKNNKFIPSLNFDFFNFLVENNSWWDSVDTICSKVIGPYYLFHTGKYKKDLEQWWKSNDFWKRRACIIFQLNYKEKTDLKFLESRILENNTSSEFFLQKAIGWALRQYTRTDSQWVIDFVSKHELKPLSKREAIRLCIEKNLLKS